MKDSILHIVKNIIQTESSFISPESVKNIVCVEQNANKFEPKKAHIGLAQKHATLSYKGCAKVRKNKCLPDG
jgi:hypothetical protein